VNCPFDVNLSHLLLKETFENSYFPKILRNTVTRPVSYNSSYESEGKKKSHQQQQVLQNVII
jgi:hypothetical protein